MVMLLCVFKLGPADVLENLGWQDLHSSHLSLTIPDDAREHTSIRL